MPRPKQKQETLGPQWRRRMQMVDDAITETALRWRHVETADGAKAQTTDEIKDGWLSFIERWNFHADLIDKHCGRGFVAARVIIDGALSCRFEPDEKQKKPGIGNSPLWKTIYRLDWLDQHPLDTPAALQLELVKSGELGIFSWMADCVWIELMPWPLIADEAGGRDSIWHRRLRKSRRAQAKEYAIRLQEFADDAGENAEIKRWNECWAVGADKRRHTAEGSTLAPPITSPGTKVPPDCD